MLIVKVFTFFLIALFTYYQLSNNPLQTNQISINANNINPIKWSNINFIHTTDTHGWYAGHMNQHQYSGNWGDFISFSHHLRAEADSQGVDLILVDTGDKHDGNGLSDSTVPNGAKSLPIFMKQDYDLVTLGNHELYLEENSIQEYELLVAHYGDKYISSNVEYILDNTSVVTMGQKYKYFQTKNQKLNVLSFSFLFNFQRYNSRIKVTPISQILKQNWFIEILQKYQTDTDLIVIFGHIPIDDEYKEIDELHAKLRGYFPYIKIQYFGGHSHIRDFKIYDSNSTGLQSGRYCETLGWLSINTTYVAQDESISEMKKIFSRSYIDFNIDSFLVHSKKTLDEFHTSAGVNVRNLITNVRKQLNLDEIIGNVKSSYFMDFYPFPHKRSIFSLLSESVLPTLKSTVDDTDVQNRIIIINSGAIRYDLYKGKYTKDSNFIISPFKNDWVELKLPYAIASKVSEVLNNDSYIMTELKAKSSQRIKSSQDMSEFVNIDELDKYQDVEESQVILQTKLSRGYVTYDDFGNDGDDTPHKGVINYPIPNIIETRQLKEKDIENDTSVQLIFFDFLRKNVLWALNELNYKIETGDIQYYSSDTVGELLEKYIKYEEI